MASGNLVTTLLVIWQKFFSPQPHGLRQHLQDKYSFSRSNIPMVNSSSATSPQRPTQNLPPVDVTHFHNSCVLSSDNSEVETIETADCVGDSPNGDVYDVPGLDVKLSG
ncbi:unnamed protein product [Protopolystoma xenopodis]|uniref:Uncharacterized protein n=1 Tax=Protopolystoma xenopodis TaxID=117903 RepID=A0A3S5AMP8_9PLAT|nr:unnamed protein product [Protopolystoma xenopodis]